MRAIVYRKLSKFTPALADFDKLINLTPNDPNNYSERGVTFLHMNHLDTALQDMNTAIDLDPSNAYRYSCRAYVKDRMKDDEGARLDYEKAIELDPDDEIAYNNLGVLLEKAGKKKAAKKNFEQSNQLLENKYGIKVGGDQVRPYTFNDDKLVASEKAIQSKMSQPKVKLTFAFCVKILKDLISNKDERQAFVNFLKRKS